MPFQIVRDDITRVKADAIVNTANPQPIIGGGTDYAIYQAAGKRRLLRERKKIGEIPVGSAKATSAFKLNATYIIHTVGPIWQDGHHGEMQALRSCYESSLQLAESLSCESIAFPLISSGTYGFPKSLALKTASDVIYHFLMEHDMDVILVVYDEEAFHYSRDLFADVRSYIDENYIDTAMNFGMSMSPTFESRPYSAAAKRIDYEIEEAFAPFDDEDTLDFTNLSLEEVLQTKESSFQDYLLEIIREKDLRNADVYHGANLSKQHFSKMISNPDYHPTKNTVCALALSMHCDLETAKKLLDKAGFSLTHASLFDLAIEYFLIHHMYNVVENNMILYDCDLELLGTRTK